MRNMLAAASVVLLAVCAPALAEAPTPRLHLALEGDVWRYTRTAAEFAGVEQRGRSFDIRFPSAVGARVGYRALRMLEVGATFVLGYSAIRSESNERTFKAAGNTHGVAAYARYLFSGERCRLFVGANVGGRFTWQRDRGSTTSVDAGDGSRSVIAGVEGGMYGHVAEALSLDPFVAFSFERGWGDGGGSSLDDLRFRGYRLAVGVALSGWLLPR